LAVRLLLGLWAAGCLAGSYNTQHRAIAKIARCWGRVSVADLPENEGSSQSENPSQPDTRQLDDHQSVLCQLRDGGSVAPHSLEAIRKVLEPGRGDSASAVSRH